MGRPLKIKESTTVDIGFNAFSTLTNPDVPTGFVATDYLGVVGGANASVATATYPVVACSANINGAGNVTAFIITQKGATKYLVASTADTSVVSICSLANLDAANLTANTMNITFSYDGDTANVVNVSKLTNKYVWDYVGNTSAIGNRYAANFFETGNTTAKSGAQADTWTNTTGELTLGLVTGYTS
jgi:hypothetical protein